MADTRHRPESQSGNESRERIVEYYSEAGEDYRAWSRGYNMHFGLYRRGMNPFRLEPMLNRMNREVLRLLDLPQSSAPRLIDLGCGLGATARTLAIERPDAQIVGITLVPWQVEHARTLAQDPERFGGLEFRESDYTDTPFADDSFDGAWALESACHDAGYDKAGFVREAYRILKPGARLVVIDGFLKRTDPMNRLLAACLRRVTEYWALTTFAEIHAFVDRLRSVGFCDVEVREESWSIAPSVLHIPAVTLKFLLAPRYRGPGRLSTRRREHVIACVLAPVVGMARRRFGYYSVTARKPER